MKITIQVALEFTIKVAKTYKVVEPGISAQRTTRDQAKEKSASHHVCHKPGRIQISLLPY